MKKTCPDHKEIRTLILTPTRELALQIEENFKIYSKYLPLSQFSVFGGVSQGNQIYALRKRVDVLVATPGRLLDLCDVEKSQKTKLLINLLEDRSINRSLIFTRTKHGADRLVKQLGRTGIFAAAIHGNKSQNARQKALEDFKSSKVRVLIATDIAARGIDIDELSFVVNYELPNIPETYVHRIGRTGRAGMEGKAISFCDEEERSDLKNIQKLIGFTMPVAKQNHLFQ